MAQRTVLILNESVPQVQCAQSGDHYYFPRDVEVGSAVDVYINQTAASGIKIGPQASGDFGWRDIMGQIELRGSGPNDPAWTQIGATSFWAYLFDVNDQIWIYFHIPHDYVPGTDIYFHTHWLSDGTDTNTVKWEWTFTYADGFGTAQFNVASPTTVTAEQAATGTAHTHMVTETAGVTISGMEVDGMIIVRLRRITNGATNNTDNIFLLTTDVHYQSNNLSTKNKAPDFYT